MDDTSDLSWRAGLVETRGVASFELNAILGSGRLDCLAAVWDLIGVWSLGFRAQTFRRWTPHLHIRILFFASASFTTPQHRLMIRAHASPASGGLLVPGWNCWIPGSLRG